MLALPASASEIESRFRAANDAFNTGTRAAAATPSQAREALAPAIAAYTGLIESDGLHSAALHYNLGNAYFLSGDLGRAVASYRRAQRLDASLPGVSRNLEAARAKVAFKESASGASAAAAASTALGWHTLIPQSLRLWCAAGGFGLMWVFLLARLPRSAPWRPAAWMPIAAGALALLAAGSLWLQDRTERSTPAGVITADRVVGRKGPDDLTYQPSFTEPLRAGFEVTILETRGDWVSVRLQDSRVTWVRASAVERV